MYKIPEQFRDLPEAVRLQKAQTVFAAAAEERRNLTFENEEKIRLVGERLRDAQNELGKAQKAFDLATGEPKPVGLTPVVVEEINKHFPAAQRDVVEKILDQECGRTIPFCREATPPELEHIRLCVLRLSKGDIAELRKWIDLANVDQRDVLLAAGPLMKG